MSIRRTSYLKKAMMPGEEALLEARLHWVSYLNVWVLSLLGLALLALGAVMPPCALGAPVFFLWAFFIYLKMNSVQFLVTSKRVVFKEGIISTHTEEIRNAKVESIELTQSIMGRILGYATIHFAGTGNSDVFFINIADPWSVKNKAEAIVNEDYKETSAP